MRRWIISEVIWYRHTVTTKQSNVVAYWIVSKKRKTPKTYLPVTSLQPRGYVAEWLRFFLVIVEGPVGCLPTVEFSCDFWQGSWGSPNLAQIFAYGKWLYPYRMLLHGASEQICTKYVWNVQFWGRIYFNVFALTPKIKLKPHFGEPCDAKPRPYYTESSP